mmetsp:Transcript_95234/g.275263  ORF Transcript_95234/g.275263 Transcript_95234/m.275263 type:complete len:201 (+) Transcript_95234:921-1523(+)
MRVVHDGLPGAHACDEVGPVALDGRTGDAQLEAGVARALGAFVGTGKVHHAAGRERAEHILVVQLDGPGGLQDLPVARGDQADLPLRLPVRVRLLWQLAELAVVPTGRNVCADADGWRLGHAAVRWIGVGVRPGERHLGLEALHGVQGDLCGAEAAASQPTVARGEGEAANPVHPFWHHQDDNLLHHIPDANLHVLASRG